MKISNSYNIKNLNRIFFLLILLFIAMSVSAWTGPSENPPDGNVAEPLNTSPQAQTKYGSINFTDWTDSTSGQTGYYVDPGGNSLFNRIYSHDIRVTVEPTEDNQVATKAYVDAASVGEDIRLLLEANNDLLVGIYSTIGPDRDLANNVHVASECLDLNGEVVNAGGAEICRFSSSSCKSGWTQYGNWSTTVGNSCSNYYCLETRDNRSVGGHDWGNIQPETSFCKGRYYRYSCCGGAGTCPHCWTCCNYTCRASVTQIGCY